MAKRIVVVGLLALCAVSAHAQGLPGGAGMQQLLSDYGGKVAAEMQKYGADQGTIQAASQSVAAAAMNAARLAQVRPGTSDAQAVASAREAADLALANAVSQIKPPEAAPAPAPAPAPKPAPAPAPAPKPAPSPAPVPKAAPVASPVPKPVAPKPSPVVPSPVVADVATTAAVKPAIEVAAPIAAPTPAPAAAPAPKSGAGRTVAGALSLAGAVAAALVL